jgi:hypothetical protein
LARMSLSLDTVVKLVQIGSYVAGAIAALSAFGVYKGNSRRERARWAENLYSKFFEQKELKKVRDLLDTDADDTQVREFVTKEASDWTDYLNFFEFVAYLQSSKQLLERDVQALFGYYLECLKRHRSVLEYIQNEDKGFDYLRQLLADE